MRQLNVADHEWDAVLVTDGSGTNWSNGAGWAAVLYDQKAKYRRLILGAFNCGLSNNGAELMPVLQAMLWYTQSVGQYAAATRVANVHVITDSQSTVNSGRKGASSAVGLSPMWAAVKAACGEKFKLHWHWLPRSRMDLNRLADYLSRTGREELYSAAQSAMRRLTLVDDVGSRLMADFNPIEDLPVDDLPPGANY